MSDKCTGNIFGICNCGYCEGQRLKQVCEDVAKTIGKIKFDKSDIERTKKILRESFKNLKTKGPLMKNYEAMNIEELEREAAIEIMRGGIYDHRGVETYKFHGINGIPVKDWRPCHPSSNQVERHIFPVLEQDTSVYRVDINVTRRTLESKTVYCVEIFLRGKTIKSNFSLETEDKKLINKTTLICSLKAWDIIKGEQ